jgi:hypothetical protein
MEFARFKYNDSALQSNIRAEDGLQQANNWNAFCEGVLLPIGSLFAISLIVLSVMLISA